MSSSSVIAETPVIQNNIASTLIVTNSKDFFDPHLYVEKLMKCDLITETQVIDLCARAKTILNKEPNILRLTTPIMVCGDVHGQFFDVLQLFKTGGPCPETQYLFLGDYVDRGHFSCQTFLLLLALKVCYPDRMHLIRGNHESRQITYFYGFYEECNAKFGNSNVWKHCVDVFDHLSLSAVIDNKVFCVHGGVSPLVNTIDSINSLNRKVEVPHEGPMCDLLWSDPEEEILGWWVSPRGAGYVFGKDVTESFLETNGLEFICRAHQLAMDGYKEHFGGKVITIWSAPNYCYRCGNVAAILSLKENLKKEYLAFDASVEESHPNSLTRTPNSEYFL